MKSAYRRSPLALAVLGLLYEAPMHPYRMQRLIKERGKDEVINVRQRASVYQTIDRLQRLGLIVARETTREERWPERTVYELSDEGRRTFRVWMHEILSTSAREVLESVVGGGASVAAALADGRSVSFCAVSDQTESLWDISIDTLEGYRRQGHAARCVSYLVAEMRRRGKEPVWAAEETNPPSLRPAAKLGFVPVDELVLFRPASRRSQLRRS